MKNLIYSVCLVLVATLAFAQDDEKGIRACYEGYKKAILDGNGTAAASFIDGPSKAFFSKLYGSIIHADSAQVASLDIADRVLLFHARHTLTYEELSKMTEHEYLVYSFEKGMFSDKGIIGIDIDDVKVEGNHATAVPSFSYNASDRSPEFYHFNKTADGWKIDWISQINFINTNFTSIANSMGQDVNEFIFSTLLMLSGQEVSATVWHPKQQ